MKMQKSETSVTDSLNKNSPRVAGRARSAAWGETSGEGEDGAAEKGGGGA